MKKRMMLSVCVMLLAISGCGAGSEIEVALNQEPIPATESTQDITDNAEIEKDSAEKRDTEQESTENTATFQSTSNNSETTSESTSTRKDGERFESVIILEGMEEPVKYEHAVNDAMGIEIDFEYESLVRKSESDKESFISVYDDIDDPDNYLEVTYRSENIDSVTVSISEELSKDYEISTDTYELDNAGTCTTIDTISSVTGSGVLLRVYLIPSGEGTIVATAHFTIESAEGFGHRFDYMMGTLVY